MKSLTKYFTMLLMTFIVGAFATTLEAQERNNIQYYTPPTQAGLNVFEAPFTTDIEFDGVYVRLGGSNTLQFQALSHSNDGSWVGTDRAGDQFTGTLADLENNFNLATSNLDFDVALAPGMRMHLRTYLSSQHHAEAWVKGGYLQIDSFDFIEEGFLSELSDNIRIKVGHMEVNYGDNHFRRSDNGAAILNPFVGNYIMDSFTTEIGGELYYHSGDLFGMIGVTNGRLNQSTVDNSEDKGVFVGKLGYDSQINDDLRVRLTGSIYTTNQTDGIYLYDGDRAGSRYYNVLTYDADFTTADNKDGYVGDFRSGRFAPGFNDEITAIMINPFVKFQGFEFYGVFESINGLIRGNDSSYNQYAAEVLYRFGDTENFYLGTRYNLVSGEDTDITRLNFGGGWFMTNNVLTKLEYVTQSYDGFSGNYASAEFSGIMLEAVVSF